MRKDRVEKVMEGLHEQYICEAAGYMEKKKVSARKRPGKAATAAAGFAAVFFLFLSGLSLAAAAGSIPAYDILYSLYPEAAKRLVPVNAACEDNGIRMEVESVSVHEDTAEIYISMTDLTGNRIDDTMDLFDSYRIHVPEDNAGTCSFIHYDSETGTATFLITVQLMEGKKIEGQKLIFSVSQFLSGKRETEKELTEISLENAEAADTQEHVEIRGESWMPGEEEKMRENNRFLKENTEESFSPADGVTVTGWGFVDGWLHVQVHYDDILRTDNHGYIYFTDAQGNKTDCAGSVSFWDDAHTGSYEEYIFGIGRETDVSGLSVRGHFWTCKSLTTGRWQVSFPVENRE